MVRRRGVVDGDVVSRCPSPFSNSPAPPLHKCDSIRRVRWEPHGRCARWCGWWLPRRYPPADLRPPARAQRVDGIAEMAEAVAA